MIAVTGWQMVGLALGAWGTAALLLALLAGQFGAMHGDPPAYEPPPVDSRITRAVVDYLTEVPEGILGCDIEQWADSLATPNEVDTALDWLRVHGVVDIPTTTSVAHLDGSWSTELVWKLSAKRARA